MIKRNKSLLMWALGGCFALALHGLGDSSQAQTSSPVFVVHGRMTTTTGVPIDGGYTIVVKNLRTDEEREDELGTGINAGKYSVVFLDYETGNAAAVGDSLQVRARLPAEPIGRLYDRRAVTGEDILRMRTRVDIVEIATPADSKTWGAIKSLYQVP